MVIRRSKVGQGDEGPHIGELIPVAVEVDENGWERARRKVNEIRGEVISEQ